MYPGGMGVYTVQVTAGSQLATSKLPEVPRLSVCVHSTNWTGTQPCKNGPHHVVDLPGFRTTLVQGCTTQHSLNTGSCSAAACLPAWLIAASRTHLQYYLWQLLQGLDYLHKRRWVEQRACALTAYGCILALCMQAQCIRLSPND
jgi:hypothetical protein